MSFMITSPNASLTRKKNHVCLLVRKRNFKQKMLHGVTSSTTSGGTSGAAPATVAQPTYADIEEELASRSMNLSSTLHKLHPWEKKLYHEVKAEEKLSIAHEKKLRKLAFE